MDRARAARYAAICDLSAAKETTIPVEVVRGYARRNPSVPMEDPTAAPTRHIATTLGADSAFCHQQTSLLPWLRFDALIYGLNDKPIPRPKSPGSPPRPPSGYQ
jgi:hypothetical protein